MTWAIPRRTIGLQILVALVAGLAGCQTPPPANDCGADAATEAIPLAPATTQEREISGASADYYELTAKTGEFLHMEVEQLGVDVDVRLCDPKGRELLRVDNFTGAAGVESVYAIAEIPGTYRLEVKTLNSSDFGRYRVSSHSPRAHSQHDLSLAEAALLQYGPAIDQSPDPSPEPPDPSTDETTRLEKALALWDSAGEPRQVALTLQRLSALLPIAEQERALRYLERAVEIMETKWHEQTAPFWNSLARRYRDSGATEKIAGCSSRAMETACAVGDRNEEAVALNSLGLVAQSQGKPWEALVFFEKSRDIWRELGRPVFEATATFNIGNVYSLLGKLADSLQADLTALEMYRRANKQEYEADVLAAIAGVHMEQDSLKEAVGEAERALELARQFHDSTVELRALERKGTVQFKLGLPEAESTYQEALELARRLQNQVMEAIVLNSLGELHAARDDPRRSLARHAEALKIFQDIHERVGECYSQFLIAKAQYRFGDLLAAREAIKASLSTTEDVRSASKTAELRSSYFASNRDRFELYIQILIGLHSQFPNRGYNVEAFEASERGRSRSLLDLLNEAKGRRRFEAALGQDRRKELDEQISQIQNTLADRSDPPLTPERRAELEQSLDERLHEREMIPIQTAGPDSDKPGSSLAASVVDLPEIQDRLLDDNTLLLSYSLGQERSFLMVVDRHSLSIHELPGRDEIESKAERFSKALLKSYSVSARTQTSLAARNLGTLLLGPIVSELRGRRLVIVAEGKLLPIPFSALEVAFPGSSQGQGPAFAPLVRRHEVINIPSASILATLLRKTAGRQPAPKTLAVLADPVFERSDSRFSKPVAPGAVPVVRFRRLSSSRDEAEAILGLVPSSQRFQALGFEATREVATSGQLSQYRIIHLATHTLLDADRPEFSGLVFSLYDAQGNPRKNGYLRTFETPDIELPADLVVLSACSTGLGKPVPGEGLVGLTHAFLNAGAARLVVSLWDVNDQATAKLMETFYRGMLLKGLAPSAALREAQLEMMGKEKYSSPYYWAPFVIEGEWGEIDLDRFN